MDIDECTLEGCSSLGKEFRRIRVGGVQVLSDLRRLGYDGSSRSIVDEGKRVVWCAVLLPGWLATEFLV